MVAAETVAFEGWAIVEMFGHRTVAGYVTTVNCGGPVMFRIQVPELPERETITACGQFTDTQWIPAGSRVRQPVEPAGEHIISGNAIYDLCRSSEEKVRALLNGMRKEPATPLDAPSSPPQYPGQFITSADGSAIHWGSVHPYGSPVIQDRAPTIAEEARRQHQEALQSLADMPTGRRPYEPEEFEEEPVTQR